MREDRVRRSAGCLAEQADALGHSAVPGVPGLRVVEGEVGAVPPDRRSRDPQRRRVLPDGQVPAQRQVDAEFGEQDVARDPGLMEQQWLDREVAVAGIRMDALDEGQVAVVQVDCAAVYGQPAAAVEERAPPAQIGDLTWPPQGSDGVQREAAPVVDSDIPAPSIAGAPCEGNRGARPSWGTRRTPTPPDSVETPSCGRQYLGVSMAGGGLDDPAACQAVPAALRRCTRPPRSAPRRSRTGRAPAPPR
jgi:hypothetical protein